MPANEFEFVGKAVDELAAVGARPVGRDLRVPVHPGHAVPFADLVILDVEVDIDIAFEAIGEQRPEICLGVDRPTVLERDLEPGIVFHRRKRAGIVLAELEDAALIVGRRVATLTLQIIVFELSANAVLGGTGVPRRVARFRRCRGREQRSRTDHEQAQQRCRNHGALHAGSLLELGCCRNGRIRITSEATRGTLHLLERFSVKTSVERTSAQGTGPVRRREGCAILIVEAASAFAERSSRAFR